MESITLDLYMPHEKKKRERDKGRLIVNLKDFYSRE